MADLMQAGVTHIAAQLKAHVSQLVSYVRSSITIASFYATPALKEETVVSGDGEVTTISAGHFIVKAADFTVEIERGDTIAWGSRTFKVLPASPKEQPQPIDPYGIQIIVKVEEIL